MFTLTSSGYKAYTSCAMKPILGLLSLINYLGANLPL
nr:MAG TPA: hypothetical protein [Crassvirales sp.]